MNQRYKIKECVKTKPSVNFLKRGGKDLLSCGCRRSGGQQIGNKRKINKYLDLARKLKKRWNTRVKVIPIVVNALGALEISGRLESIQTTALPRSARIPRKVLENSGNPIVTQTPVKAHQLMLV